jgi:hypothetical protein
VAAVLLAASPVAKGQPPPASEAIRVLTIDGHPGQTAGEAETRYLHVALSADANRFRITRKAAADVTDDLLAECDLVILANVAEVPGVVAGKLKTLVAGGGGLMIFVGDRVKPESYNKHLYEDGKGILPARLGEIAAHDRATLDLQHVVYEPVKAFYKQYRLPVTVSKSYRFVVPEDESVRVVCPLSTGEPAIVDRKVGRGRVILFATTCDTDWTNWPLTPAYITVLFEAIQSVGPEFRIGPQRE